MSALVLSGATVVLPDRLLSPGTLVLDGEHIAEVRKGSTMSESSSGWPLHGHVIVPGFIDVHAHGLGGVDTLDGNQAVQRIAAQQPRHGVTAFCPTTMACAPHLLRAFLADVRMARGETPPHSARVLPAHLESNFLNPDYAGAQPIHCLRSARGALDRLSQVPSDRPRASSDLVAYDGDDILREIAAAAPYVGTVTIAPEIDGGLDLIQWLVAGGHRVSLGHSGATYEEAMAAVAIGARQATHLFNRMPPVNHRAPGLAGAVLQTDELAAEVIGDGVHVHPATIRIALAAKGASRVLAITDSTAVAGLPAGARARLGEQSIVAGPSSALLDDGTLAGSTATMDRVFRTLVNTAALSLVDAATLCATTPARELALPGLGSIVEGAVADLVVLGPTLEVVQTYVGGRLAWSR